MISPPAGVLDELHVAFGEHAAAARRPPPGQRHRRPPCRCRPSRAGRSAAGETSPSIIAESPGPRSRRSIPSVGLDVKQSVRPSGRPNESPPTNATPSVEPSKRVRRPRSRQVSTSTRRRCDQRRRMTSNPCGSSPGRPTTGAAADAAARSTSRRSMTMTLPDPVYRRGRLGHGGSATLLRGRRAAIDGVHRRPRPRHRRARHHRRGDVGGAHGAADARAPHRRQAGRRPQAAQVVSDRKCRGRRRRRRAWPCSVPDCSRSARSRSKGRCTARATRSTPWSPNSRAPTCCASTPPRPSDNSRRFPGSPTRA